MEHEPEHEHGPKRPSSSTPRLPDLPKQSLLRAPPRRAGAGSRSRDTYVRARPRSSEPPTVEIEPEPAPELVQEVEPEPAAELPGPTLPTEKGKRRSDKEIVGLRIGSTHIVAALVRNSSEGPVLLEVARRPIERGLVVAGEVREPDALATELKTFFAETKLPRKAVRLGIASNRIGVRTLEVPAIDDPKLLENAIRFRAQELLSIPLNEAVCDHLVIGSAQTDEGPGLRVLLAFAHRELIDRYVEACRRAKIKLLGIDFDAFALLRAVATPPSLDAPLDRAEVVVAIGRERTIFAVAEGETCDYTRVLDWGGNSLAVAVARALNMTPSEAEPVKCALSFEGEAAAGGLSEIQIESARGAMRNELQLLARELLSSLQFYQSRPDSLAIGEILLTGGGAQVPGTDVELSRLLGVPVRVADPFAQVEVSKKVKPLKDPGSVSIAVGLGIER